MESYVVVEWVKISVDDGKQDSVLVESTRKCLTGVD